MHPYKRGLVLLVAVVALTVGLAASVGSLASAAGSANVAPATCGKLLPPSSGVYFGAAPDFVSNPKRLEGGTVTRAAIEQFDQHSGRAAIW